jgi:AcrR family transcriptional regulator
MKLKIDPAKKDTKLPAIMEAAVTLFVERGIDGTSIKEIAAAADVAEGALYRHFKSKEDLAWSLFAENLKEYTAHLFGAVLPVRGARERIRIFTQETFAACEMNRALFYYLLLSEHRSLKRFNEEYQHPGKLVEQVIAEGQKAGELRPGDAWVQFAVIVGSVHRLCSLRCRGSVSKPLTELVDETVEFVWRSVAA